MYRAIDRILKEIAEIENRLNKLEGITVESNSSRPVFHSLRTSDEKKSQHELSKQNENLSLAADLIIEHYKRVPPKRQN